MCLNPAAEHARLARQSLLAELWEELEAAEGKAKSTRAATDWRRVLRTKQMRDDARKGTSQ